MVDPSDFGPHLWKSIHYMAIGAPKQFNDNDKHNYKQFFKNLGNWIPCEVCSQHYKENFTKINIDDYLKTNITLFQYTHQLHNNVNKILGKRIMPYEEAYKIYSTPKSSHTSCLKNWIIFILLVIIIAMLLYLTYTIKRK